MKKRKTKAQKDLKLMRESVRINKVYVYLAEENRSMRNPEGSVYWRSILSCFLYVKNSLIIDLSVWTAVSIYSSLLFVFNLISTVVNSALFFTEKLEKKLCQNIPGILAILFLIVCENSFNLHILSRFKIPSGLRFTAVFSARRVKPSWFPSVEEKDNPLLP